MIQHPPVIVIRGNDICFLGIIRSLGRAGIPFRTISFTWEGAKPWWSESSRFFSRDYSIANPFAEPKQALQDLIRIGEALLSEFGRPLLTIPSSDTNLMLFLDNEELLNRYYVLQGDREFASYRSDVAHKFECFELLSTSDSAICPHTLRCSATDHIPHVVDNMIYPCVFKPAVKDYGQTFYAKHAGLKAVECETPDELKAGLISCIADGFDLVVQEKIIFDRAEDEIPFYGYVDEAGHLRIAATGIKDVIQPYPFGTANLLRLSWHPELLELAQEVVHRLRWRGLVMIEFINDKKDGKWKVIEINVRPWLFIGFYDRFGLHYVRTLYQDWIGEFEPGTSLVTPSDDTTRQAPLHIDLNSLYAGFTAEDQSYVFASPQSLLEWASSFGHLITTTYMDHEDPDPDAKCLRQLSSITGILTDVLKAELYPRLCDTGTGDDFTDASS
ncbi:MAG: hypothetical protein GKR90_20655 [Pseudomonadales bacterium]|nr:hypothetical protein [Pseudomonadales bacterium]